jgi:hypothetical protein
MIAGLINLKYGIGGAGTSIRHGPFGTIAAKVKKVKAGPCASRTHLNLKAAPGRSVASGSSRPGCKVFSNFKSRNRIGSTDSDSGDFFELQFFLNFKKITMSRVVGIYQPIAARRPGAT